MTKDHSIKIQIIPRHIKMIVRLVATKMRDYFACTEIKDTYELFKTRLHG